MVRHLALLLLASVSISCSNGTNGTYYPTNDGQTADEVAADLATIELPDVPNLDHIELDEPDPLVVKFTFPSSADSFTASSGTLTQPFVVLGGVVYGQADLVYIKTDLSDDPIPVEPSEEGSFSAKVDLRKPGRAGDVWEGRTTTVWVVAQAGEARAYDVAVVTANPGFVFPAPLTLVPDVLFAHEANELRFSLDLNQVENFNADQVYVMEVEPDCATKIQGTARKMADDGDTDATGDPIALDRVYSSWEKRSDLDEPGVRYFRAAVTTTVGDETLVAYGNCLPVRVVERINPLDCSGARSLLQQVQAELDLALAKGWSLDDARKAAVDTLRNSPIVAEAGAAQLGDVVWVRFSAGFLGALSPTEPQPGAATQLFPALADPPAASVEPWSRLVATVVASTTGGTAPETTPGLDVVSDVASDAGEPAATVEEEPLLAFLEGTTCPPLRTMGTLSSLATMRRLADAGYVLLAARGGTGFNSLSDEARAAQGFATREFDGPPPAWLGWDHAGGQQVVWLEDDFSCDTLAIEYQKCKFGVDTSCTLDSGQACPDDKECIFTHGQDSVPRGMIYDRNQADLAIGRLVLGPDRVGLTPSFVQFYGRDELSAQFVVLGFPYSARQPVLAAAFVGGGANSVLATTGPISPLAAQKTMVGLFDALIEEGRVAAEVVPRLGLQNGDQPWRLAGAGNVDVSFAGLLNAHFATGNLRGWATEGDARTLFDWCGVEPAGSYMGLISNGIGYAFDAGSISQEFCLQSDKLIFEAYYNFISHEFLQSCGTEYNEDRLEMYMEDGEGQRVYLVSTAAHNYVGHNALCPCDAGDCGQCEECGSPACDCGELYDPEQMTLWPEECGFDLAEMGSAYASGWRHTGEVPLTNLGQAGFGKPVRLVIRVSDESGHQGNTAVLVDSINLK